MLGKLEQIFEQQLNRDVYEIMNDLYKIQLNEEAKNEQQLVEKKNENDKKLKHEEEMILAGQSFKDDFVSKNQQLDRDIVHKQQELDQANKIAELETLRAKERYMSQIEEKDAAIVDLQAKANALAEQVNAATDALLKAEQARDFEVSQHENRIRKQQGDLESLEAQLHEQRSRGQLSDEAQQQLEQLNSLQEEASSMLSQVADMTGGSGLNVGKEMKMKV